jgi:hypothetical protein
VSAVEPRDGRVRRADTLAKLVTPAIDAWVSTASAAGEAHLVPLSLAWVDERVVIALAGASVTARNISTSGRARLGIGPTRDVVMIDAGLDRAVGVGDDEALARPTRRRRTGDPRSAAGYVFLVLRPVRVQAWREANEIAGRTLMREGRWLV